MQQRDYDVKNGRLTRNDDLNNVHSAHPRIVFSEFLGGGSGFIGRTDHDGFRTIWRPEPATASVV